MSTIQSPEIFPTMPASDDPSGANQTPSPVRKRSRARGCLTIVGYALLTLLLLVVGFLTFWTISTNRTVARAETFQFTDGAPGTYVTIDGYQMHYRDVGVVEEGTLPLLLVHGFNANAGYEFAEVEPYLAASRRLIIPDLIGFGYSERATEAGSIYTDEGQAASLADLLDALGIQQVDVVGASFGGRSTAQLALDYPDRVRSVILSGADLYIQGGGIFERMGELPLGIGRANTYSAMGAGGRASFLFTLGCQAGGWCPGPEKVALRQRLAEIAGTTDAYVAMSATESVSRLPADLPHLEQPTLVVWGEKDAYSATGGERLANDIPNATLATVAGSDHTPHHHIPDETSRLILDFTAP